MGIIIKNLSSAKRILKSVPRNAYSIITYKFYHYPNRPKGKFVNAFVVELNGNIYCWNEEELIFSFYSHNTKLFISDFLKDPQIKDIKIYSKTKHQETLAQCFRREIEAGMRVFFCKTVLAGNKINPDKYLHEDNSEKQNEHDWIYKGTALQCPSGCNKRFKSKKSSKKRFYT